MKATLPLGGIAVSGKTGSGKSSHFFASDYVRRIIIADTGSLGHKAFHRGDREKDILVIDPRLSDSPVQQVGAFVDQAKADGELYALDSFTTLQEQQNAWTKIKYSLTEVSLPKHKVIVGDLIDLALYLARTPGFTLFNTCPGGMAKQPDGSIVYYPKGSIVGYPALAGTGANREPILSRFTSSWVVFPGWVKRSADNEIVKTIPRGYLVPGRDLRPDEASQYTPLKDPLGVIREATEKDGTGKQVDEFPPFGTCGIDEYVKRILIRMGELAPKSVQQQTAEWLESQARIWEHDKFGTRSELMAYVFAKAAELKAGQEIEKWPADVCGKVAGWAMDAADLKRQKTAPQPETGKPIGEISRK